LYIRNFQMQEYPVFKTFELSDSKRTYYKKKTLDNFAKFFYHLMFNELKFILNNFLAFKVLTVLCVASRHTTINIIFVES